MADKSTKRDDNTPFDYFKEVQAAQKPDKTNVSDVVKTLRTDMIPASNAEPAKQNAIQRDQIKVALGIFLGIVIVGFFLFIGVGPGRPFLEQNLASLAQKTATHTLDPTSTAMPPTPTPVAPTPTNLPSASPTLRPTRTPVVAMLSSPTPTMIPPSATPTPLGCRDVLSITLDDVGKELCVQGVVLEIARHPTDFMVVFSYARNAFYWVSYDLVWTNGKAGSCYRVTGSISKINYSPVLVFDYRNLPEACP